MADIQRMDECFPGETSFILFFFFSFLVVFASLYCLAMRGRETGENWFFVREHSFIRWIYPAFRMTGYNHSAVSFVLFIREKSDL